MRASILIPKPALLEGPRSCGEVSKVGWPRSNPWVVSDDSLLLLRSNWVPIMHARHDNAASCHTEESTIQATTCQWLSSVSELSQAGIGVASHWELVASGPR